MEQSISTSSGGRNKTGIQDTRCPPFPEIIAYLFSIVFSVAMIGYILVRLSSGKPEIVPLVAYLGFIAFGLVIVYCCARLIQGLFLARRKGGHVGSLVKEIIEIDGVNK